jgi:hypothetical protein
MLLSCDSQESHASQDSHDLDLTVSTQAVFALVPVTMPSFVTMFEFSNAAKKIKG